MSVTISPSYVLRKCDPAPYKCGECGALVWVSYEDYNYGRSRCDGCGDEPWDVDFYPTEFEKKSVNMGYGTLRIILDRIGVPFDYSGEVSTALVRSRLHRLNDYILHEYIVDMVESAEQHGVDLHWA